MNSIKVFEKYAKEYDLWFEKNRSVYESELIALRTLIPKHGKGLEIGVGTGRFSSLLGIKIGIDPAINMLLIAKERDIEVCRAKAEMLPFKDCCFDFILMVTVLCFLDDLFQALREAKRVIKGGGHIIIGMIDRESELGKLYESKRKKSKFYSYARFYSVKEVLSWLKKIGFKVLSIYQTIFQDPKLIIKPEPIKKGYGEGGFIAISAKKSNPLPYLPELQK